MKRVGGWLAVVAGVGLLGAPAWVMAQGTSGDVSETPNYGTVGAGGAPQYNATREYERGVSALGAGQYKDAVVHFQRAADTAPRAASTWLMLGLSKSGADDEKGAEKAFEKAVKLDDSLVQAHRELALSLIRLKEPDRANAELARLRSKAAACGEACPDAAELKSAIDDVVAALGSADARPAA